MKSYQPGNCELLMLIRSFPFDREHAFRILSNIDDINLPFLALDDVPTTYLYEAQACNNIDAVRFLLEQGADPNFNDPDLVFGCPLWELQYPPDKKEDFLIRYKISKLFFANGANPNIECEGETLFDFVTYEIYNHRRTCWEFEYLCAFYKLLVLYGGGGKGYAKPAFSESIIRECADEYFIIFHACEDGYHIEGQLINPQGKIIGIL